MAGVPVPDGMGRVTIPPASPADSVYSEAEEEQLARRLEDLGYL